MLTLRVIVCYIVVILLYAEKDSEWNKRVRAPLETPLSFNYVIMQEHVSQGLEGYSRDPGFGQNTVQDSGKREISWRDSGFVCYQGSGIRQNLGTGCEIFFACLSGIREIAMTQVNVLAAKANQPGERKISMERPIYILNLLAFAEISLF